MMGVPLMRTKLAAYAVGAVAGGLGGVAFAAHINGVIADRFHFSISITLLAMVVLGGMGNVWGVIARRARRSPGSTRPGCKQFGNDVQQRASGRASTSRRTTSCIFGVILVLMMLFRREGLLPESADQAGAAASPSAATSRPSAPTWKATTE